MTATAGRDRQTYSQNHGCSLDFPESNPVQYKSPQRLSRKFALLGRLCLVAGRCVYHLSEVAHLLRTRNRSVHASRDCSLEFHTSISTNMSVMDDFTFHPSPAPATSLDSGVSMDQVFTGRVLQPVRSSSMPRLHRCIEIATLFNGKVGLQSTEQNKENGIRTDVNKMPSLSPQQVPTTPKLVKPIRMVQTSKKADELPAMVDLVNWRNPPAAFCMMLCGAVLCFTAHYLFGTNAPFLSSTFLACSDCECTCVLCCFLSACTCRRFNSAGVSPWYQLLPRSFLYSLAQRVGLERF